MKLILLILIGTYFNIAFGQNWQSVSSGIGFPGVRLMYSDTIYNYLYVSGDFTNVDGKPIKYLAKWNGIYWDSVGVGLNSRVLDLTTHNNKLYAGGYFTINGSNINQLAVWDGNIWDSLSIQPNLFGPKNIGTLFSKLNDLYVAGQFDTIAGIPANSIAKWTGTNWSSIGFPNLYPGQLYSYSNIKSICEYKGKLYVGGIFNSSPIDTVGNILAFNGNFWESVSGGIHGSITLISSMIVFQNELYVAGEFLKVDGNVGNNIQKFDGISWSDVGDGTFGPNGSNGQIWELTVFHNELYAGGVYSTAGGVQASKIAKFDGVKWCGLGSTFSNNIIQVDSYRDSLFVAGGFIDIDNSMVNYIAKWNGGSYSDSCQFVNVVELEKLNFDLVPNPSNYKITLTNKEFINSTCSVLDIYGKLIRQYSFVNEQLSIETSGMSNGIYFIKIELNNKKLVKKFVVQH